MANLKQFKVRVTSIVDNRGVKVQPGQLAHLDKAMADHYNALGFLVVPIGEYKDERQSERTEQSAAQSGNDDEAETGDDAADDAGENPVKAAPEPTTQRRRTRTSS